MHKHLQHDQQEQQRQQTITGRPGMAAALVTVGALVLAVACFGSGATPALHATPRRAQPAHARPAAAAATVPTAATVSTALLSSTAAPDPTELAKVTLPETSPTGPALWTIEGGASSSTYNAALGWTGTDLAHHVNVRTSVNGLDFGPTLTLGETAISRPAVAAILGSTSFPRILVLAWTGTDARHSLNVLFDVFNVTGHRSKRTLVDTSIAGPALVRDQFLAGERLQLAWSGTDPNHSLNVLELNEVCTGSPLRAGTSLGCRSARSRRSPASCAAWRAPSLPPTSS